MQEHADSFDFILDTIAAVEVIPIQKINEAYEQLAKSEVKYRFSIDMASLKGSLRKLRLV
jgi:D-arabinose 1-dehydrogenase-like Zn-dependent alcohol dehydrogenase